MSAAAPTRRNDPCPCGSGRRFKECHGSLDASNPENLIARALREHQGGRVAEAERLYDQVLAKEPDHPVATHYLGMATWQRGDVAEAERLMRRAIALDAAVPDFHNNLGLLLRDARRTDAAIASYRKALEVDPAWFEAHNNLGLALEDAGRFDDAVEAYRAAIAREPRFAAARQNMARLLLTLGRYAEGWHEYRWRLLAQGATTTPPQPEAPRLPASLAGKRIALIAEQGIGDVLFFLRFAPELARRGATLGFRGDTRLHGMLERTGLFNGGFAGEREAAPGQDGAYIGDLPWLLEAHNPASFPPALPLRPLEARLAAMKARLEALGPRPWIGLTWRAGTSTAGPSNAQLKELPIDALGRALRGRKATWVSIQRLPRPDETERILSAVGAPVHDLSDVNNDLEEALAVLSLLDGYVGVSNANTHLRAGLGKSQEVLVPFPPEWRWGASGSRSDWFPGMTVHRQSAAGDWSEALAALED